MQLEVCSLESCFPHVIWHPTTFPRCIGQCDVHTCSNLPNCTYVWSWDSFSSTYQSSGRLGSLQSEVCRPWTLLSTLPPQPNLTVHPSKLRQLLTPYCSHHHTAHTRISASLVNVTVEDPPVPFSPFSLADCTMHNHFSFNDFVAIAFPDLAGDLDIQL